MSRTAVAEHHLTWVQALPGDGPFLTIPVLTEALPNGLEPTEPDRAAAFKYAYASYRTAPTSEQESARQRFIATTARDVLDWGDHFDSTASTSGEYAHTSAAFDVTTTPAFALWPIPHSEGLGTAKPTMLGFVWPPDTALNRRLLDGWAATPIDRVAAALRHHDIPLGIVTNARTWVIVWAPRGSATGWVLFDTHAMLDDRQLLDAFTTLLARRRHLAVADTETLNALLHRALQSQEDLTQNLSTQVRRAVEMLVDAVGRADTESSGRALDGVDADHVYEGAVTIVMRLVFMLAAEERRLLPGDDAFYATNYGIGGLADRLIEASNTYGEEVLARQAEAFPQILATSRVVHEGVRHQALNIQGYGGSVFDPDKYPWLEGAQAGGPGQPIHVDDRTLLHILKGLTRWQGRRLAYRTLDVEQIGYVYEGLLDHTALKAEAVYLGLRGSKEPEVTLDQLEAQAMRGDAILTKWLRDATGLSPAQVKKALGSVDGQEYRTEQTRMLRAACGGDPNLAERIAPYLGLLRKDERTGQPVIFVYGSWFVTASSARSDAGSYYTPRHLAEEVVKHTLDALVYNPGPLQTLDEERWRIVHPDVILALKVADIAMGSGAFLVAADRYLAARLIEAIAAHGQSKFDDPALDRLARTIAAAAQREPNQSDTDSDEATVNARRLIATRCLYGADINPTAVEMAKLSLWLATAAKDQPFGFLDHRLAVGDSLLGLTDARQLIWVHPNPAEGRRLRADTWLEQMPWRIESALHEAIGRRRTIEHMRVHDLRDVEQQQALLSEVNRDQANLQLISDAIAAGMFKAAQTGNRVLDDLMSVVASKSDLLLAPSTDETERAAARDWLRESTAAMNAARPNNAFERAPVEWVILFPEVFVSSERTPGFDAIIGNPPFLGGKKISTAFGVDYETSLKADLGGVKGAADLATHFLRRAWRLLSATGQLGLIVTAAIVQGDSVAMGLKILVQEGCIRRARTGFVWPGSASVVASIVHASRQANEGQPAVLDGRQVGSIGMLLTDDQTPDFSVVKSKPLPFVASIGTGVYGGGFLVDRDSPLLELLAPIERLALKRFLNGRDLATRIGAEFNRFIIDLGNVASEDELHSSYPHLGEHLARTVKPIRDGLTGQIHEACYWKFWDARPRLYEAMRKRRRVIAGPRVTRVPVFDFVETEGWVISDQVVVLAVDDVALLGVMNSSLHLCWAAQTATKKGEGTNYVVSRCLRTFPFPPNRTQHLESSSEDFVIERRRLLESQSLSGVARLHDDPNASAADALREARIALDAAAIEAYDLDVRAVSYEFREMPGGRRFMPDAKSEARILTALLERNHEDRAAPAWLSPPADESEEMPTSRGGNATLFD